MKKRIFALVLAGALTLGLSVPALAVEDTAAVPSGIAVQLNGEALTFPDAVPLNKDGRTVLPFRAVFEALGAQVSWRDGAISAVRGDTSIAMTVGDPRVTVTKGDQTTTVVMDVAPFIDPATGRTYVPVRFAAQALGCAVGWDPAGQGTAILVDPQTLLDQATEGKKFTLMEKFLTYSEKYNEGTWDCPMTLSGTASLMGIPITLSGEADATVADGSKMDMDMTLRMDMRTFLEAMLAMAAASGATDTAIEPEGEAMLKALAEEGIAMSIRGDLEQGKLYLNADLSALDAAGETPFDSDTWYLMDLNEMTAQMAQMGVEMDFQELMQSAKHVDYKALLTTSIQSASFDDAGAYAQLKALLTDLAAAFSDDGFTRTGNTYTTSYTVEEDGAAMDIDLTLDTKWGSVVGYAMDMTLTAETPATEASEQQAGLTMGVHTAVDAQNKMDAQVTLALTAGGTPLLAMDLTMDAAYTRSSSVPQTEPPAGAAVVPYADLLSQAAPQE